MNEVIVILSKVPAVYDHVDVLLAVFGSFPTPLEFFWSQPGFEVLEDFQVLIALIIFRIMLVMSKLIKLLSRIMACFVILVHDELLEEIKVLEEVIFVPIDRKDFKD